MGSVRDRIFETLRAHGMTTMFGNPGSTELPFLGEFPEATEQLARHLGDALRK